ncbi:hypothetical protein [Nonomuraea coxensis]|uniref:hypothetical protein n=1 Tax=Nonomuraea coxensis TaxID=404386 RepID=UPI0003689BBE|nr:hypothetical protein [Nonomuraea coxensis]
MNSAGPHNHLDLGHFVLRAGGRPILEELEVRGHDGRWETVHRVRLTASVPTGTCVFTFRMP